MHRDDPMDPLHEPLPRFDGDVHRVEYIAGARRLSVRARMVARLLQLSWRAYRDPTLAARAARAVLARAVRTDSQSSHLVRVRGRVFGRLAAPGFPSLAFDRGAEVELNRQVPFRQGFDLPMALVAVTRRCALHCQHCSEADTLHQADPLTVESLRAIVTALQARGASHIELTGAEPLQRLDAVEAVVRGALPGTDFWVLTSGALLTAPVARRLADAGVTGVTVSLDHWDPPRHDAFRGAHGTFTRAVGGMRLARDAGLVVAASVTATRETANLPDLLRILDVARAHGATFARVLEPQAAGRWAHADVSLRAENYAALRGLARAARARWPDDAPILNDVGYIQQREGCPGAGAHYVFVDAAGEVHACPFCHGSAGHCLRDGLDVTLARLRARGCRTSASPELVPLRAR